MTTDELFQLRFRTYDKYEVPNPIPYKHLMRKAHIKLRCIEAILLDRGCKLNITYTENVYLQNLQLALQPFLKV